MFGIVFTVFLAIILIAICSFIVYKFIFWKNWEHIEDKVSLSGHAMSIYRNRKTGRTKQFLI